VVFVARRATFEVREHAGDLLFGVHFGQLELHVVIEILEALLAGELRSGGSDEERQESVVIRLLGRGRHA